MHGACDLAEAFPNAVAPGPYQNLSVGGGVEPGRDRRGMIVAGLLCDLADHEPARGLEIQHGDHRLDQRRVDPPPNASPFPFEQDHQHGLGKEASSGEVDHRDADAHRPLAGQAGDGHEPAHPLHHLVDARAVAVGTGLSEAGNAAIDDARIDGFDALVVDPEAMFHVGAHVFEDDVGLRGQLHEDRLALRRFEVERQGALVAMQVDAVGTEAVAGIILGVRHGERGLYAQHVRTPICEMAGGRRAGAGDRDFENLDAREGQHGGTFGCL